MGASQGQDGERAVAAAVPSRLHVSARRNSPLHGVRSRMASYRLLYNLTNRRALPDFILTTEQIGRAMLAVTRNGAPKRILESKDINALAHC